MATDKLVDFDHVTDYISREAAILKFCDDCIDKKWCKRNGGSCSKINNINAVPAADVRPEPPGGIGEMSDGYHTFNGLYYQRMVLFAALVNQNKDSAWKSHRHEDGELCFGGGWFIVGLDTPKGSYTYHYEDKDWDLFDCEELPVGKHWDGHTEDDVTRLLSLPEMRPVVLCRDCVYYNTTGCADGFGWCEGVMVSKGTSDDFFCAEGKQNPYECGADMRPNLDTTKGVDHD